MTFQATMLIKQGMLTHFICLVVAEHTSNCNKQASKNEMIKCIFLL
jgi:hypothetical protein